MASQAAGKKRKHDSFQGPDDEKSKMSSFQEPDGEKSKMSTSKGPNGKKSEMSSFQGPFGEKSKMSSFKGQDGEKSKMSAKQRRSNAKMVDFSVVNEEARVLSVAEYASCRAKELEVMAKAAAAKSISHTKQIQLLPIHMRRRAMSHDVKRFPCRLRYAAEREGVGIVNKRTKRPSRKHRRRPKNLLAEYARRQRNHVWLETHIWHAKRFKMVEKWGYKIPLKSNFKGVRASHRGAAKHCLLFDMSYLCCIEIRGKEDEIIKGLSHMLGNEDLEGLKGDKTMECKTTLHKCNQWPLSVIGPVRILWQGQLEDDNSCAWLWVHPTCHEEVFDELEKSFNPSSCEIKSETTEMDTETDSNDLPEAKKEVKENRRITIGGITLVSIKDELNRYSLVGPESHRVISECFDVKFNVNDDNGSLSNNNKQWWTEMYLKNNKELIQKEMDSWASFCQQDSPNSYPDHSVLAFTVSDPRLSMPGKKEKVSEAKAEEPPCIKPSNSSPIWDPLVRKQVTTDKMSDSKLNKLKGNSLVPGTAINLGANENKIPILLVQNPGKLIHDKAEGRYGCGWDIIVPSGWGMPFWMTFVYKCARASALADLENLRIEQGLPFFPISWPDSTSGVKSAEENEIELQKWHKKRPPAKRPNYKALKVSNPFDYPWKTLCKEWCDSLELKSECSLNSHVIRSKNELQELDSCLQNEKTDFKSVVAYINKYPLSLVCFHITQLYRGVPEQNSMICIPTSEDLEMLSSNPHYEGPMEAKASKKMKKDDAELKPVLGSCSRQCIGYVTQGKFTFTTGKGAGLGFCSLIGLYNMFNSRTSHRNLVLIRNKASLQYRFARINISDVIWEL